MKQKIKLMEQRPQLSDEEIRSYMDFDRLLADKKLLASKPRYSYLKWVAPALVFSGLVTWFIFNSPPENAEQRENITVDDVQSTAPKPLEPVLTNEQVVASPQKTEPKVIDKATTDLLPSKEEKNLPGAAEKKVSEDIYVQAEPLNGYSDLYAYFNSNLVYPIEALKDSTQGVETVSFVVNTEGKPEKITIKQSLGEPFEKEARRLIENMPLWKPATLNGKPIASQMSIPLTFQIQKVNVNR